MVKRCYRPVKQILGPHSGPQVDITYTERRRKLGWYGHVTRPNVLAKIFMEQCEVKKESHAENELASQRQGVGRPRLIRVTNDNKTPAEVIQIGDCPNDQIT